jgi:proline dehydrogenase
MRLITRMARSFVAGDTISDALEAVAVLGRSGVKATLDVLGESVKDRDTAEKAVAAYLELLDAIDQAGTGSHVSLKLTQQGLDIDPDYCYQNVRKIVQKAKLLGNFVRIDMEGTPHTQLTLDLFTRLRREFDNVGIVIQAYLYRSEKDIADMIKVGARVRLCKGAYKEPKELAMKKMKDIRAHFTKLADILFREGDYPAIATHDFKLVQWTKDYVAAHGIPHDKFEFQYLYGIRTKSFQKLAAEGYRVRCYVPFGTHWLPYNLRRLRERKENVWFVIKNLFKQ